MTNSSNRRPKSSNKTIKPKDQVVDVTPLNSTTKSKTSSRIQSSSAEKASNTKSIPSAKNLSNASGGGGSFNARIGQNKAFETNSNFGIALGMIETRGFVAMVEASDAMVKAANVQGKDPLLAKAALQKEKKLGDVVEEFKKKKLDTKSASFCAAKWYNATIWLGSDTPTTSPGAA